MHRGYIKLWRKLKEWDWYGDKNTCRLFVHLLLSVNYQEKKWQGKTIYPGEIITSHGNLSKDTDLSVKQIRLSLNKLKRTGDVAIKTTNKYSLISINNWIEYQQEGEQKGKQRANKGQQLKKEKNIHTSNENKIFSFFKINSLKELKTSKQIKIVAEEFDIREKDVVYCVNDMIGKCGEKNIEIKSVKAKLRVWINNAIRWHKVSTLSNKEVKKIKDTRTKAEKEEYEFVKSIKIMGG